MASDEYNIDITDDEEAGSSGAGNSPVEEDATPEPPIDSDDDGKAHDDGSVDDDAERNPDGYIVDPSTDGGTSGTEPDNTPPPETPPVPEPEYVYTTVVTEEFITDYSQASLAKYRDSGAKAIAVYDDGTEQEIDWAYVTDPSNNMLVDEILDFSDVADEKIAAVQADIDQFKQTADATYASKTYVDQETQAITTNVSANYVSKTDAATTYATKTEVQQTSDSWTTMVETNYATKTEAAQMAQPNLTPYFSHDFSDKKSASNPDGYWVGLTRFGQMLGDGWASLEMSNTSTTTRQYANFYNAADSRVKPGEKYTLLIEWRNSTFSDGAIGVTASSNANAQMNSSYVDMNGASGSTRLVMTAKNNALDSSMTMLTRTYVSIDEAIDAQTPCAGSIELRASLYEGDYKGPYKPYVDTDTVESIKTTYATKSELSLTDTSIRQSVSENLQEAKTYADGKIAQEVIDRNAAITTASNAISLNVSQTYATKDQLQASSGNLLRDWNAPTLAKVEATKDRYFSDASVTSITCSMVEIQDPPFSGVCNGARIVCDGTNTAKTHRGLAFYSGSGFAEVPIKAGQVYTASWWARVTSGNGATYFHSNGYPASNETHHAIDGNWKLCIQKFSHNTLPTNYTRAWFHAEFDAETAGTVEICGFSLVPGTSGDAALDEVSRTYATKSELALTDTSITSLVEGNATYTAPDGTTKENTMGTKITQALADVLTAITGVDGIKTLIREYSGGVLVCKVGGAVGALVNASGSFDVVNLTWSGETPSVTSAMSTFGSNSRVGNASGDHIDISSNGLTLSYGSIEYTKLKRNKSNVFSTEIYPMDTSTSTSIQLNYTVNPSYGSNKLVFCASTTDSATPTALSDEVRFEIPSNAYVVSNGSPSVLTPATGSTLWSDALTECMKSTYKTRWVEAAFLKKDYAYTEAIFGEFGKDSRATIYGDLSLCSPDSVSIKASIKANSTPDEILAVSSPKVGSPNGNVRLKAKNNLLIGNSFAVDDMYGYNTLDCATSSGKTFIAANGNLYLCPSRASTGSINSWVVLPNAIKRSDGVEVALYGSGTTTANDLSLSSTTCVAYSTSEKPVRSKWGNLVNVCGAVKPVNEVAAGGTLVIATLPDGYRPRQPVVTLCQGSGNSVWMLRIKSNGEMTAERYRNGASANAAMTTSTWLPFNVTFTVD